MGPSSGDSAHPPNLVADVSSGLAVFTGGVDRTLTPTPFPTVSISKDNAYAAPFVTTTLAASTGALTAVETDFFVYDTAGISIYDPPSQSSMTRLMYAAGDTRVGVGVVASFDNTVSLLTLNRCDQLALAFNRTVGAGHVSVWSPCATPSALTHTGEIDLPAGVKVCSTCTEPLQLFDVDFDGNLNLVIVDATNQLNVAYSDGMGHFSATPGGPFTGTVLDPVTVAPLACPWCWRAPRWRSAT